MDLLSVLCSPVSVGDHRLKNTAVIRCNITHISTLFDNVITALVNVIRINQRFSRRGLKMYCRILDLGLP
jgi:hypothetical protein